MAVMVKARETIKNLDVTAKKAKMSATARASLCIPPAKARQCLVKQGVPRVSDKSAVVAAAVVEYIIAEVLEVAGKVTKDNKRTRVTLDDVSTAVRSDDELNRTVGNICLAGYTPLRKNVRKELGALFV